MGEQAAGGFEEIKARLDAIVDAVSDDDIPFDEALDLYEEAVGLGLQASRIMEEGIAESNAAQEGDAVEAAPSSAAE